MLNTGGVRLLSGFAMLSRMRYLYLKELAEPILRDEENSPPAITPA
jgi:hypothetical protein